ncbi:autotransporter outer membrane beta-barrel domain-containing protein, partial [Salmonella enterica]|nr:autotransporter outer membrane beta-barrel domain-containing protein [Salmonella enterica]EJQ8218580.1 autotransporter outer membrane beta-barrel domain-containing protein [Salmonella enterica]EJX3083454.1 autotransporter outer membrane beta-barrel domain-containing protein [Salmonella enterica]EJX3251351.1 autotransporter outer membrane beta-barrel domain-containing protein [Salmonella enterica]EJX3292234.1 autotransporter outer membrane beta-barrel domain-containing protein [Salmonella ent
MRKQLSKKKLQLLSLGASLIIGSGITYGEEKTISEGDGFTAEGPVTINVTGLPEKPWAATEIYNEYKDNQSITINLQDASHNMSTTITGRNILQLALQDLNPKQTYQHDFVILAPVQLIIFNSLGTITNTGGNVIKEININKFGETTISNMGQIDSINGYPAKHILNFGIINGIGGTEELTNYEQGIIRTHEFMSDAVTTSLTNYGEIEISMPGLRVGEQTGSVVTNYGKINSINGGPLIVDDWGGSTIVNYGTITSVGESIYRFIPGTILIDVADSAENEIKNVGTIRGESVAITSISKEKVGQLRITNEGTIEGDIVTTGADDGARTERAEISLNNKVGGVWAAGMKGWDLHGEKILYNKFKNVTNQGLIKTLNDSRPGRSTITAASFMNDGKIDVTAGGLTIIGDYTAGANSSLVTAAALMGDETELPTLVINGSVSGETTKVDVVNLGGTGAATVDGILVVRADTVDGDGFSKGERIVAGAYDYDLVKVQGDGYTEWRLTSELTPEPPGPTPPVPPGPTPPVPPGPTPP